MRIDQYQGLNKWAQNRVSKTIRVREVGVTVMPDKSVVPFDREVDMPLAVKTKVGEIKGAFADVAGDLYRYTFASGVAYEEYVQCTPWSGGPMYFIALRRVSRNGKFLKQSLWPSSETQLREENNNSLAD
jgi:hypothetical protein